MTVRFCLSYDPLKWDFIDFKMNIISIRKHIVDMDIVNDAPKCYYTCGNMIYMTQRYPLNNSDVINKFVTSVKGSEFSLSLSVYV